MNNELVCSLKCLVKFFIEVIIIEFPISIVTNCLLFNLHQKCLVAIFLDTSNLPMSTCLKAWRLSLILENSLNLRLITGIITNNQMDHQCILFEHMLYRSYIPFPRNVDFSIIHSLVLISLSIDLSLPSSSLDTSSTAMSVTSISCNLFCYLGEL